MYHVPTFQSPFSTFPFSCSTLESSFFRLCNLPVLLCNLLVILFNLLVLIATSLFYFAASLFYFATSLGYFATCLFYFATSLFYICVSHQWCDLFSSTTAQLYATHRKSGQRRKRHCTKYTGLRPCWRSLRQMRVSGHAGRSDVIMAPPPPHSTCKQAKFSDF